MKYVAHIPLYFFLYTLIHIVSLEFNAELLYQVQLQFFLLVTQYPRESAPLKILFHLIISLTAKDEDKFLTLYKFLHQTNRVYSNNNITEN